MEEIRRNLPSQLSNMAGGGVGIKGRFVDEFERPSSHAQNSVFTLQLNPAFNDAADSDMGKRAPDVGEDLDGFHTVELNEVSWHPVPDLRGLPNDIGPSPPRLAMGLPRSLPEDLGYGNDVDSTDSACSSAVTAESISGAPFCHGRT